MRRNGLMPNAGKRFLMIYLFGKLGENIFTKKVAYFVHYFIHAIRLNHTKLLFKGWILAIEYDSINFIALPD